MSPIGPAQAAAGLRARLGRPAQDYLEAAVVLEAWAGVAPARSLPLAAGCIPLLPVAHPVSPSEPPVRRDSPWDVAGLAAAMVATAAWIGPLSSRLGTGVTTGAWRLALPIAFAAQWFLRRRYLGTGEGLRRLRADVPFTLTLLGVVAAAPILFPTDPSLLLMPSLVIIWLAGLVLTRRGWGVGYAGLLVLAITALHLAVPVTDDVEAVLVVTALLAGVAVATTRPSYQHACSALPALQAALVGGGIGLLIALDPQTGWAAGGALPILAMLPSLAAMIWAGARLNSLWSILPAQLAQIPADGAALPAVRRALLGVVGAALTRLVVLTAGLSALLWAAWTVAGSGSSALPAMMLSLGGFATVSFVAGLLEALQHWGAAAGAVAVAGLAATWRPAGWWYPGVEPALAVAAGALLVGLVTLVHLAERPDLTMARLLT